ncbi:hypothetical protein KIH74_12030 [Kineosporia sp. J2-2]|uniref:Uncharacterized protein n=1 Tax=Kineosporia corallincola TaxID=2835133 RepID=A0ABS5TF12_9ACTN|nr:hypothetical protein [Kineosporia corallincola]MBT0769656.1 hypothetical protein [Kineosporia corallincola]
MKDIAPEPSGTYHLSQYLTPGDDPSRVLREVAEEVRDAGGGTISLPPGEYSLPDPAVLEDVDLRGGLGRTVVIFDAPAEHSRSHQKHHLRLAHSST